MDESNVYSKWKHVCVNNEELIRICMQVKELINMQDRCMKGIFKRGECNDIIEFLCTDWLFSMCHLILNKCCLIMANKIFKQTTDVFCIKLVLNTWSRFNTTYRYIKNYFRLLILNLLLINRWMSNLMSRSTGSGHVIFDHYIPVSSLVSIGKQCGFSCCARPAIRQIGFSFCQSRWSVVTLLLTEHGMAHYTTHLFDASIHGGQFILLRSRKSIFMINIIGLISRLHWFRSCAGRLS